MSEDVRVTNWPDSGSPEEVAYKLWSSIANHDKSDDERLMDFAKCLAAAKGMGRFSGTNFK